MKKINQLLVLIMVTLVLPFVSVANSGNDNAITGNGNVITENRTVNSFHAIEVSGGIDVELTQGSEIKCQVEADESIIANIVTKVDDGVLKIYPEKSIRNAKTMRVKLTFQNIDAITASGGCDIESAQKLNFSTLNTELSGGCDVELDLKVNELICKHSGGCDAEFSGEAENCTFNVVGGSDLKAEDLKIRNCIVNATGGSDVSVYVTGELEIKATGASDITYAGSPTKVTKSNTGGSDIHSR